MGHFRNNEVNKWHENAHHHTMHPVHPQKLYIQTIQCIIEIQLAQLAGLAQLAHQVVPCNQCIIKVWLYPASLTLRNPSLEDYIILH